MKTIIHQRESEEVLSREFTLGSKEALTYIFLHTLPSSEKTSTHLVFRLAKGSILRIWNLIFGGERTELRETITFEGEEASSENSTIYFGEGFQNFQMFITNIHEAPATTSRIFSRGILKDCAFGRYDGMIKILQSAKKADAFLEEKTLLLSEDAKSEAIPGLEIGTNDVRASHSASATRIDESRLFYATSRGIPEVEALRVIAEGFLEKFVSRVPDATVRKFSRRLIHDKLSSHVV